MSQRTEWERVFATPCRPDTRWAIDALKSLPRLFAIAFLLVLSGFLLATYVPRHIALLEYKRELRQEIERVQLRGGGPRMGDPTERDIAWRVYGPLRKVYAMYAAAGLAFLVAIGLLYRRRHRSKTADDRVPPNPAQPQGK